MTNRGRATVLALSLVVGCTRGGERKRTTEGAVYDAGTGSDAGAGGVGGDAVGYYMDRQRKGIEQVLAREDRVEREGETLRVALSNDLLFDSGSPRLQLGARDKLAEVARVLNEYPRTRLDIIGHSDSRGGERSNQRLSERRARVVRDVLVREGVDAGRMTTRGAGEDRPAATNDTAEGRAMNRRVEIVSRPEDGLAAEGRATRHGAPSTSPENETR